MTFVDHCLVAATFLAGFLAICAFLVKEAPKSRQPPPKPTRSPEAQARLYSGRLSHEPGECPHCHSATMDRS